MKQNVENRWVVIYTIILGAAYIILGAVEFALGIYNLSSPMENASFIGVPADIFGGLATLVIGATYLSAMPLLKGLRESLGFILVGTLLSTVFGVIYLLIVCADGLGTLLASLEGEEWTWEWLTSGTAGPGLLRPEIWLFFASLPLGIYVLKTTRKEKFPDVATIKSV
jgi:hypothetical protein